MKHHHSGERERRFRLDEDFLEKVAGKGCWSGKASHKGHYWVSQKIRDDWLIVVAGDNGLI